MYKTYNNYSEWKNLTVQENARKFWFFDIPANKFTYYVFIPNEVNKERK